jgi:hypothetical protein
MLIKKTTKANLFSIPFILILSGCGGTSADIKAAEQLAKLNTEAKVIFPTIAGDVSASCRRTAELTLLIPPTANTSVDVNRQKNKGICKKDPDAATKALNSANRIILAYLESLGGLASNDLSKFDKELSGVSSSLQELPKLDSVESKQAFDAGTAIASFLFKAATDSYRRQQLKIAVTTVDAPLKILVKALDTSVREYYIKAILEGEQNAVDIYYRDYLGRLLTAPLNESVSLRVETETKKDNEWRMSNKAIDERKKLAASYLQLLNKIAEDHHNLYGMYVKGGEPSPTQVKGMIDSYSEEIKALVKKTENLSPRN